MAIKTLDQIKERKAFIAEADTNTQALTLEQSFKDLKKMTVEDLVDRLEQIENQSTLIKWRIWWAIRQHFPSDKLFGQYINELRSTHQSLVGSQQHINLCINAGRFCEKHKINDLTKIGISATGIYELARPVNDEVATDIFKDVKHKGYQVDEIKRRISQAKVVSEIEYDEQPEELETPNVAHREPYTVEVERGRVVGLEDETPPVTDEEEQILEQVSVKQEGFAYPRHERVEAESDDHGAIVEAILAFVDRYQLSPLKMIAVLQDVIKRVRDRMY